MFSSNEKNLAAISDPEIEAAFKDLMAASWNELPRSLVEEAKKAVSKATDDAAGQEALKDRKSTRLNSSHSGESRMPSSA